MGDRKKNNCEKLREKKKESSAIEARQKKTDRSREDSPGHEEEREHPRGPKPKCPEKYSWNSKRNVQPWKKNRGPIGRTRGEPVTQKKENSGNVAPECSKKE